MWAFGVIMEVLLAILIAAFATTQILWPALNKQPLFPSFRKRARELTGVEDEIHDTELAIQIKEKRQALEELLRRAEAQKRGES